MGRKLQGTPKGNEPTLETKRRLPPSREDPELIWRHGLHKKVVEVVDSAATESFASHADHVSANDVCPACQESNLGLQGTQPSHIAQDRLDKFLQLYAEPIAVRTKEMRNCGIPVATLCYWFGPLMVRHWVEDGKELFGLSPSRLACGWGFTVRLRFISQYAATLIILLHREISQH